MARINLHTNVDAPVEPLWEVVTTLDEKGLGSLGIHLLETSTGGIRMEDGMVAKLRLAMKVSRFTVGGLVKVRIEDLNEQQHRLGVNILDAPDGVRGKVNLAMAQHRNDETHTDFRIHGDLKLPFKAALAFPLIQPILESHVMPHVGETLARKAQRQDD